MFSSQPNKPTDSQPPKRFSGSWKDFFILVCALVLGFCFGFLSDHVRNIGNYWISMVNYRIHHNCCLLQLCIRGHNSYWKASWLGMVIEVAVILVVLVVLWWFYHRRIDDTSEIKGEIKGLRNDVNKMRNDLVSAIDRLGDKFDRLGERIGGANATTESETDKKRAEQAKEQEENGRTQDN